MEISKQKSSLRKNLQKKRDGFDLKKRQEMNKKIFENFLGAGFDKKFENFLIFYSVNSEPDTIQIIKRLLEEKQNVFLPRCMPGHVMNFYRIDSLDRLEVSKFGIPEPKVTRQQYSENDNTLCIVPGFSFDSCGYRIGYGGGYYDRFIAEHKNIKYFGICYEDLLLKDIPKDKFDMAADGLITDVNVKEFR